MDSMMKKIFLCLLCPFVCFHLSAQTRIEQDYLIQPTYSQPEDHFRCGHSSVPEFPGGERALIHYLHKNMVYPDSASRYNIQGTVKVRFVVSKDGSISDVTTIKPLGFGLDEEAIRLVCTMPKWDTGHQSMVFYLPVKFCPE